jgi:hypothetical protein
MTNEELSTLIIKELSQHHNRNDIISKICDQSMLTWKEADNLITDVEAQNKRKIAARQSPLLIFFSIGIFIAGIWLLVYNIQLILSFPHRDLLGQILSVESGYYRIIQLVTGLGMTVGGLYGMWKTLSALFPDS